MIDGAWVKVKTKAIQERVGMYVVRCIVSVMMMHCFLCFAGNGDVQQQVKDILNEPAITRSIRQGYFVQLGQRIGLLPVTKQQEMWIGCSQLQRDSCQRLADFMYDLEEQKIAKVNEMKKLASLGFFVAPWIKQFEHREGLCISKRRMHGQWKCCSEGMPYFCVSYLDHIIYLLRIRQHDVAQNMKHVVKLLKQDTENPAVPSSACYNNDR